MTAAQPDLRQAIIDTARRMDAVGLNRGASGNVSARRPDGKGLFVTPSGRPAEAMRARDVVTMDWDGAWQAAPGLRPSSEWRFHRDILAARPEFGAVVHAHPVQATALAVHGRAIPAFHYMVAIAGGADIRCAPYATFGSQALSDAVLEALVDRRACLMAHHGILACGRDLTTALALAVEVETLAAQYLAACVLGEPPCLDPAEMATVLEKFASGAGYGSTTPAPLETGLSPARDGS
jgi:L-fuculose-phosphate aldolase